MVLDTFCFSMAIAFLLAIFAFLFRQRRLLWFQIRAVGRGLSEPGQHVFTPRPPAAAASSSRSLPNYHVFLSFRGKDVRKGFLSHLYKALTDANIIVFHDDRKLQRGKKIWGGLTEAIEKSSLAIVLISENYASSRWCLEELLHITECAEKKRLQLIPVFYGVDPSHMKTQTGSFREAFENHEKKNDLERVKRWRTALGEVGMTSGWDSRNWNEDSKLIDEIVRDLQDRLFSQFSSDTGGELIGMSSHMRGIYPLLCMNSIDVRMVGIWGMGGIGKTTIAKFVRKHLSNKFQGVCLLENVKAEFKEHGSSNLREKILSRIQKEYVNIRGDDSEVMKQRLCRKKVLLVLDDVDKVEQLQELVGSVTWFGPGSRIIITTRDKRVLVQHDVEHVYEVKPLRTTQALELFSKHAFKQPHPQEDFRELSINVVSQLGCLPLALKVIGESLYRRDICFWQHHLILLKNGLNRSISNAFRGSYKALNEHEKMIFLYIACYFNGEYVDRTCTVLDLFAVSSWHEPLPSMPSIIALTEKCLISVSKNKRLRVHDLLQGMAREIVCKGKEENPWKRKMLWNFCDIRNVFHGSMGTEAIEVESIFVDMNAGKELLISPRIFKNMFNLKLLKFYNNSNAEGSKTSIPDGLLYLPMLRYLYWQAYTLKSLPSRFCTSCLVELNLPDSSVETLWSGTQDIGNLNRLILNRCRRLLEIPDLSKAKNLQSIHISNCESLVVLPSSLRHLNKLVELSARDCKKLKNLPRDINLKSLRFLDLDGCSSLNEFPYISEKIERLGLNYTSIEEVPPTVGSLSRLEYLRLSGCKRLKNLPDTVKNLSSLRYLWLANCPNITEFPQVVNEIKMLHLNGTAIKEVPPTIGDKSCLLVLDMSRCQRLQNLPQTLRNARSLKFLYLHGCTNVTMCPQTAGPLRALDLYGTSIERYQSLSKEEELKIRRRQVEISRGCLLRYAQRYIKERRSG